MDCSKVTFSGFRQRGGSILDTDGVLWPQMKPPFYLNRPFFAYGLFAPGQLGFLQLKELVREIVEPSRVSGSLMLRDGLPIIDPGGSRQVLGASLRFKDSQAAEDAYNRISKLEPDRHYRWGEARADGILVNLLIGKSPRKGSVTFEGTKWDGWDDPLLTSALDVVEETLKSQQKFEWDLKPLFRLQMAYLLLWSAIERYVSLRYHFGDKVTEKVNHLADEPAFATGLRGNVKSKREVYRADRPDEKVVLDPERPEKALSYYYQIRSNITHRGKGVARDHERVLCSLGELLTIFRGVIQSARRDARVGRHFNGSSQGEA